MNGLVKFSSPGFELNGTAGGEDIILQLRGAESYGSRYFEGSPDVGTFSAGGNANSKTGADFAIKGDGTCQIRGSNILTENNYLNLTAPTGNTSVFAPETGYLQYYKKNGYVHLVIYGTFKATSGIFATVPIPTVKANQHWQFFAGENGTFYRPIVVNGKSATELQVRNANTSSSYGIDLSYRYL